MVRRLPIRRKSIVLPALCLLALLTVVLGVAWLTWVGIPRPLLDCVCERAEREGIYLKIEEAYLAPDLGLGLKVEGVELYADRARTQRLLHCDDISAGVRLMPLLCGEVVPVQVGLGKARISLPVDERGRTLELTTGGIVLNGDRKGALGIATAHLCVQDFLDLNFSGRINLPTPAETQEKKDTAPLDIAALLRENRELLYTVYERIENLKSAGAPHIHIYTSVGLGKWDGSGTPPLHVRTRFDIEELDVKPMAGITLPPLPGVEAEGTEVQELPVIHLRDFKADVEYHTGRLHVNSISLRTVQPDTEIALRGAYDLNTREAALQIDGQLMLFDLLRTVLGDDIPPVLRGIRSNAKMPLGISVKANAELSDIPGEAPKRAEVRVGLDQKDLYLGPTLLKQAYLSFFYNGQRLHVDKLKIMFDDDRGIEGMFNTGREADVAYLHGEVDVQDVLDIAEYFTGSPIALPEGLTLGSSLGLDAKLRFVASPADGEPTRLEELIPRPEYVHAVVRMPGLSYGEAELLGPRISLVAEGCRAESATELPFVRHAQVRLSADSVHLGTGEEAQTLSGVQVNLHARELQPLSGEKALGVAGVSLQAAAEHADGADWHAEGLTLALEELVPPMNKEAVQPRLTLAARRISGGAGELSLSIPGVSLNVACRLPQGWEAIEQLTITGASHSLTLGEARVDNAALKKFEANDIPLKGDKAFRPTRVALELGTGAFSYGSRQYGELSVRADSPGAQQAALQCLLGDTETGQALSLVVDWSADNIISLRDMQANLHPAALADFLTAVGVQTEDIRWPEALTLAGSATLGLAEEGPCLHAAEARVELPHLVRTSHNVPMLRGRENEVALSVAAQARQEKAGAPVQYSGTLQLTHLPGKQQLNTRFRGNTAGQVHITGETDILPTVIDELLDLNAAHEIIRDFRMPAGAQSKVSDIDVTIDYSNGLSLHSVCRAELRNIEYLLGGIEEVKDADGKPTGEEVLNKEDGVQPFSALNTVSCIVDVVEKSGMKDAQGNIIPRETIITLRNPYMDFNNAPWLRELAKSELAPDDRANPPARSVLKGESVVLDIQRSTVELNKLSGTVYPAYSIGTFYYPLRDFMKDVLFFSPVDVRADYCRFPIADDCTQPMTGTISLRAPRDTVFDFLSTGYPLDKLTGFIRINDTSVYLDRLNAMTFSGIVNAQLNIDFSGEHTLLDGYVNMKNVNLRELAAAYGADLSRALCAADFRFRYQLPDLNNLKGYGSLSVIDGNLLELGIFSPVRSLITLIPNRVMSFFNRNKKEAQQDGTKTGVLGKKAAKKPDTDEENPWDTFIDHAFTGPINHIPFINHFTNMTLREAYADFGIVGGHLLAESFKVKGNNLNVHVNDFDINLDTLGISATLEPKVNSLPGFLFSTLDYLFNFKITGTVNEISWSVLLRPGIPEKDLRTIKSIFGEAHPTSKKPEPLLHPKPARKSSRKRR